MTVQDYNEYLAERRLWSDSMYEMLTDAREQLEVSPVTHENIFYAQGLAQIVIAETLLKIFDEMPRGE